MGLVWRHHTPVRIGKSLTWLVVLIAVILAGYILVRSILTRTYPIHHRGLVSEAAALFDVDPLLILSVIKVESNFDASAVSPRGAVGLMQVMPDTANWIADDVRPLGLEWVSGGDMHSELHDPRLNILMGSWYLSHLSQQFSDLRLALAAYNSGQGRVVTWLQEERVKAGTGFSLDDIPFVETRDFVNKVLSVKEWYERLYASAFEV